jgi:hypothetical protein
VLGHKRIELSLLEHLTEGANGEAQGCHRRTQTEGILHRPDGPHLVVTEADPEAAGFTLGAAASPALFGLGALGNGGGVLVGHGRSLDSGASVPHRQAGRR